MKTFLAFTKETPEVGKQLHVKFIVYDGKEIRTHKRTTAVVNKMWKLGPNFWKVETVSSTYFVEGIQGNTFHKVRMAVTEMPPSVGDTMSITMLTQYEDGISYKSHITSPVKSYNKLDKKIYVAATLSSHYFILRS